MYGLSLGYTVWKMRGDIRPPLAACSLTLAIVGIVGHVGQDDCAISPHDKAAEKNDGCVESSVHSMESKPLSDVARGGRNAIIQSLVAALISDDYSTSLLAGVQLLEERPQLCTEVIKIVNSKDYSARKRATWSLTGAALVVDQKTRRDCDAVLRGLLPTLIEIAHDRDKVDRGSAGAWMGILVGGKDASEEDRQRVRPALAALLGDSESYTRWKAIEGVLRMGPSAKPLVPALADRLTDPAPYIRRTACVTLGLLGPDAKAVIPSLRTLADNSELKDLAREALRRIETDVREVETKGEHTEGR